MNEPQQTLEAAVRTLLADDDLDAAVDTARAALALAQSPEMLALLGVACAKRGLTADAIEALRLATWQQPDSIRYWTLLAEAQLDALDQEQAAASLARACELDPTAVDPHGKRARVLIARTRKQLKASPGAS